MQTLFLCDGIVNNNLFNFFDTISDLCGGGGGGGGEGVVIQIFSAKKKSSLKMKGKHQSTGFSSWREVYTFIIWLLGDLKKICYTFQQQNILIKCCK